LVVSINGGKHRRRQSDAVNRCHSRSHGRDGAEEEYWGDSELEHSERSTSGSWWQLPAII